MPQPQYAGPEWQAVRRAVLARDGYVCQIKRPKCKGRATEVDHIVAISDGGARLDPANLRASCKSCNIGERNAAVAARARGVRAGDGVTWLPGNPTQEQYLASTGYDWPEPLGGWG